MMWKRLVRPMSDFVSYSIGEWTDFWDRAQHRFERSIKSAPSHTHTQTYTQRVGSAAYERGIFVN